jgi:hypothetical protein
MALITKKIGIELELAEGEKATEAIHKAKLFVQSELSSGGISADLLESFVRQIKNTQDSLKNLSEKAQQGLPYDDEIPFQ